MTSSGSATFQVFYNYIRAKFIITLNIFKSDVKLNKPV